ncbi:RNA polymerase sigma factor RpoD/SigA [Pedobacter aquatilis]|uniref:sigma-70 family RNA polymerase sigma factor n=1 Tax=Pedobacter aquatilis TaxID=351343 RepID=UPI00292DF196|nr:sigma-70 family RNA polymerase sigma factor [Pedobacter aquatilis]
MMKGIHFDKSITHRDIDSLGIYLKELNRYKPLEKEEEAFLSKRIQIGDQQALNKLVQCNLKFVITCAKHYSHLGAALSDLINEGNIGLITAAKRHDPSKGFRFISYAVFWIRNAMLDYLSENIKTVRRSGQQYRQAPAIRKTIQHLEHKLERTPTDQEILETGEFSATILQLYKESQTPIVHLDAPQSIGEADTFIDILETEEQNIEEQITQKEQTQELQYYLSQLKPKYRQVIIELRGLGRKFPMSIEDIASKVGLTTARVWQIDMESLKAMKSFHREHMKKQSKAIQPRSTTSILNKKNQK